jgi:predicted nucleotidyltransferase
MRLNQIEVEAIITETKKFLTSDFHGKLVLFGSRTKDHLKGGDIDLALIGEDEKQIQELKTLDYKILAAMKLNRAIGDQKIDLKILTIAESKSPFFEHALSGSQILLQV